MNKGVSGFAEARFDAQVQLSGAHEQTRDFHYLFTPSLLLLASLWGGET